MEKTNMIKDLKDNLDKEDLNNNNNVSQTKSSKEERPRSVMIENMMVISDKNNMRLDDNWILSDEVFEFQMQTINDVQILDQTKEVRVTVTLQEGVHYNEQSSESIVDKQGTLNFTTSYFRFKRIEHEFSIMCLTGKLFESDIALGQFKYLNKYPLRVGDDNTDKKTPDYIFARHTEDSLDIYVMEFKTTTSTDKTNQVTKAKKYMPWLQQRKDNVRVVFPEFARVNLYYGIIVVGLDSIITNIGELVKHEALCCALLRHHEIARSLKTLAQLDVRFAMNANEFDYIQQLKIDESIQRCKLYKPDGAEFMVIDENLIELWESIIEKHEKDKNIEIQFRSEFMIDCLQGVLADYKKDPNVIKSLKTGGIINKKKQVVRLPLIYVNDPDIEKYEVKWIKKSEDWNIYYHIASEAFRSRNANLSRFTDLTEEQLKEEIEERRKLGPNAKSYSSEARKLKNRKVDIPMTLDILKELVLETSIKKGTKHLRNEPELINKDTYKEFDWLSENVDVSDIDNFIQEDVAVLFNRILDIDKMERFYKEELINDEYQRHLPRSTVYDKVFQSTLIGNASRNLGMIVEEANLSMKHYCEDKPLSSIEFELKELFEGNMYMIIKPTGPKSHFFYSVLYRKDKFSNLADLFPKDYNIFAKDKAIIRDDKHTEWGMTEFFTSEVQRISHTLSSYEELAVHWFHNAETFSVDPKDFITPEKTINEHLKTMKSVMLKTSDPHDYKSDLRDAMSHFAFCILMSFDPNSKTSENTLVSRYYYMEAAQGWINGIEPEKVFDSFDLKPRRRLNLFFLKNSWIAIKMMKLVQPFNNKVQNFKSELEEQKNKDTDLLERSTDSWSNLISWVNLRPLKFMKRCVHVFYLGVIHNKDEGDKVQGQFAILAKDLEEEEKMYSADVLKMKVGSIGYDKTLKSHEWSNTAAILGCKSLLSYLRDSKFGVDDDEKVKEIVAKLWIQRLSLTTPEVIATLKSSAVIAKEHYYRNPKIDSKLFSRTQRLTTGIISMLEELNVQSNLFEKMPEVLEKIDLVGGLYVIMFKKNQHGGPREIAILDCFSRVAMLLEETWARVFSELFPWDKLNTKKGESIQKRDLHARKVAEAKREGGLKSLTLMVSGDCSRWAPSFVMTFFGFFFKMLVPKRYHNCLFSIMNFLTSKKIEIPSEMLKKFIENPDIDSKNRNVNRLKEEFLGKAEGKPMFCNKSFSPYFKNLSNMLQGIGQEISNVTHLANAGFVKTFLREQFLLWKSLDKLPPSSQFRQDFEINSDDSSAEFSVVWDPNDGEDWPKRIMKFLLFCSEAKSKIYPQFCALDSKKKTARRSIEGLIEFKSNFYAGNTHIAALIKFTYTACKLKPVQSLKSRQNVLADHRRQIIENGGSSSLAAFVQLQQIKMFYRSLGMSTNKFFTKYWALLSQIKHPAVGYFMPEPEEFCGYFGMNFAEYIHMNEHLYATAVQKVFIRDYSFMFSKEGESSIEIDLHFGEFNKWKKWLKSHSIPENWKQISDIVWFRNRSTDANEANLLIWKKMTNPSSALHFSYGTSSLVYAQSAFILQYPYLNLRERPIINKTFTTNEEFQEEVKNEDFNRVSLIEICEMLLKKSSLLIKEYENNLNISAASMRGNQIIHKSMLSDDFKDMFFPSHVMYDFASMECKRQRTSTLIPQRNTLAFKKATVNYVKNIKTANIPLNDVLLWFWFNKNPKSYTDFELNNSFKEYAKIFTWLQKTAKLTQESGNCPFSGDSFYMSVADFAQTLSHSVSSFSVLSPLRTSPTTIQYISKLINYNYSRHAILVPGLEARYIESDKFDLRELIHETHNYISKILSSMEPTFIKNELVSKLLIELAGKTSTNLSEIINFINRNNKTDATLLIFSKLLENKTSGDNLTRLLDEYKLGTWGMFNEVQKQTKEGTWIGKGIYSLKTDDVKWRFTFHNDELIRLETSSRVKAPFYVKQIMEVINNLDLKIRSTVKLGYIFDPNAKKIYYMDTRSKPITGVEVEENLNMAAISLERSSYQLRLYETHISFVASKSKDMRHGVTTLLSYIPNFGIEAPLDPDPKGIIFPSFFTRKNLASNDDLKKLKFLIYICSPRTNPDNRKFNTLLKFIFNNNWVLFTHCYNHVIKNFWIEDTEWTLNSFDIQNYCKVDLIPKIQRNLETFCAYNTSGVVSSIDKIPESIFDVKESDNIQEITENYILGDQIEDVAEILDLGFEDIKLNFDEDQIGNMKEEIEELSETSSLSTRTDDDISIILNDVKDFNKLLIEKPSDNNNNYYTINSKYDSLLQMFKNNFEGVSIDTKDKLEQRLMKLSKQNRVKLSSVLDYQDLMKRFITRTETSGQQVMLATSQFFRALFLGSERGTKEYLTEDILSSIVLGKNKMNLNNEFALDLYYLYDGENRNKSKRTINTNTVLNLSSIAMEDLDDFLYSNNND